MEKESIGGVQESCYTVSNIGFLETDKILEMLTGQPPFKGQTRNELYEQTLKGEIIFPEHISAEAKDLILKLLCKQPENRFVRARDSELTVLKIGIKGSSRCERAQFFQEVQH